MHYSLGCFLFFLWSQDQIMSALRMVSAKEKLLILLLLKSTSEEALYGMLMWERAFCLRGAERCLCRCSFLNILLQTFAGWKGKKKKPHNCHIPCSARAFCLEPWNWNSSVQARSSSWSLSDWWSVTICISVETYPCVFECDCVCTSLL